MSSKESELKEERERRESELQMATFEFEKRLHEERNRWEEEMDRILSSKTELQDCKQVLQNNFSSQLKKMGFCDSQKIYERLSSLSKHSRFPIFPSHSRLSYFVEGSHFSKPDEINLVFFINPT